MGERRALLISTDVYADQGFKRLRAPERDTRDLEVVLADRAIGACEVSVLRNSLAHQTHRAIEDFFADAVRDDFRLIYLSGHGIKDEQGELYFVATDSRRERLASTAISADFVHRQIDRSRCRSVVVWLDCCFAGAFPAGLSHRGAEDAEVLSRLSSRGRVVMTSSTALEYSFESGNETPTELNEMRSSVFTRAIVEGLRTGDADRNQDGLVDSGELYDYVYDQVQQTTPRQTPLHRADVEGPFTIAAHPRGASRAGGSPAPARAAPHAAVRPPNPDLTSSPTGADRRGPNRRTVLLSAVGALVLAGVPAGLYLTTDAFSDSAGLEGINYFARKPDGTLRHWYSGADGTLLRDSWGGGAAGDPAVLLDGADQHVWARDGGGNLQHWWWGPTNHGSDGGPLHDSWGRGVAGDPAALLDGADQHVWARDGGGNLQHWWWGPTNHGSDGGPLHDSWGRGVAGDPAALLDGADQHVWARDGGGNLQHWWWGPTNHGSDGGPLHDSWGRGVAGDPAALLVGADQHVWARDAEDNLQHWWWGPTQQSSRPLNDVWGSGLAGDPTALLVGADEHVWARDVRGDLQHWWWGPGKYNPAGSPFRDRWGQGLTGDPTALLIDRTPHVFAVDSVGVAHHWWWDPDSQVPRETTLGS